MRIFGRSDVFLVGGLAIAVWVVSSRQLGTLLDRAREIDHSRGLQLVPALFILAGVFVIHQVRKREEMRIKAAQAASRVAEMERLVDFGQALAKALDGDSIRAATTEHLPVLASGRQVWAMFRTTGDWIPLTPIPAGERDAIERAAARATNDPSTSTDAGGDKVYCFPLVAAGTAIGAIGISPEPPLTEAQRSVMIAAAQLLGASVKNAELFNEAHENSVRDSLTGCFNRRHSTEVMDAELRRARRSRGTFSVVMFDLDHFKAINDRFGHLCGDAVLAQVGHRMKAVLRGSDIKCRYGGEEFLILLPDVDEVGAHATAERLRENVSRRTVAGLHVTVSAGCATWKPGENPDDLLRRADAALYAAKRGGRDQVQAATG